MYKILFIGALPIELNSIKKEIKKIILTDIEIDFLLTKSWNYNTIYSYKNYIDKKWVPDFVVNLGICWKTSDDNLNLIQIYRIKNLANKKEILLPIYINFAGLNSISCSEKIITDSNDIFPEKFVDMESYWIDFVSTKEKIPYIILKVPFDIISKNSKYISLEDLEIKFSNVPYKNLIEKIKDFLDKNKKEEIDFSMYFSKYKLTFTEKEIIKRNYNKFLAYNLDFLDFFEKNKDLKKEDFIKKMNEI